MAHPQYSVGEVLGLDAGQYGKAILEVTGFTDISREDGGTLSGIEVRVLESSHPDFEKGTTDVVPANNHNLKRPRPGTDPREAFGQDAA